jgi:hypothetical protein
MNENLELSEHYARISETANDATIRSIFARISELHRLLHAEEQKLAEWLKKQDPSSRAAFIYKKPRE